MAELQEKSISKIGGLLSVEIDVNRPSSENFIRYKFLPVMNVKNGNVLRLPKEDQEKFINSLTKRSMEITHPEYKDRWNDYSRIRMFQLNKEAMWYSISRIKSMGIWNFINEIKLSDISRFIFRMVSLTIGKLKRMSD